MIILYINIIILQYFRIDIYLHFFTSSKLFFLDIIAQKMESAKSEPNLAIQNISFTGSEEYLEENKENCVPDEFNDQNIK